MDLSRIVHDFPSQKRDHPTMTPFGELKQQQVPVPVANIEQPEASKPAPVEIISPNGCILSHPEYNNFQQRSPDGLQVAPMLKFTFPRATEEWHGSSNSTLFGEQQKIRQEMVFDKMWGSFDSSLDNKLKLLKKLQLSNITRGNTYGCVICMKRFRRKSDLSRHLCVHLDIRPFSCPMCSKHFVQKGALNVHRRVHEKNNELKPSSVV